MSDSAKYNGTFQYGRNGSFNPPVSPYWQPTEYDMQPSVYFLQQANLSASNTSQTFQVPSSFGTLLFLGVANRGAAACQVTYTCTSAAGTQHQNVQVVYPGATLVVGGKVDPTQPIIIAGEDTATAVTTVEVLALA